MVVQDQTEDSSSIYIFAFIIEIIIVLIFFGIVFTSFYKAKRKEKAQEKKTSNIKIKKKKDKLETDLDVLYNLLKEKKKLSSTTIMKTFKIPKEKALEWVKILQNNKLIKTIFPMFSSPIIVLRRLRPKKLKDKKGKKDESAKSGKGKALNEDENLDEDDSPFKRHLDQYMSVLKENKIY